MINDVNTISRSVPTPKIRFFQFESDKLGVFTKSINLFRGDINFNRRLFSMPGRPGRPDLDVQVALQYQSNLQEEVTTQNLDAPTGILGLGWSMPLQKISLEISGSLSKGNRTYRLHSDDSDSLLVLNRIENGKEYYELASYQFWIISYDPKDECWEIVHENGVTHTYGGSLSKTSVGYNTSRGNSIAWGVRYGNWTGSTRLTKSASPAANPSQYAREWYLSEIRNPWGDRVQYEYNGFARGENGLIEDVEQFVGDDQGQPYTKAVYLTKIIDVFNRTAVFRYGNKTFDMSSPEAPKEYQAPHTDQPNSTTPNGFQDVYETKYLTRIDVNAASGQSIKTIAFDYHPLQNLTAYSGALKGNTYKRYLKSITLFAPGGTSLPGLSFLYYWDKADNNANLGALKSITNPQGAVATYTYQHQALDICQRSVQLSKPDNSVMGNGSLVPRVWFGETFTVVTWYNIESGKLWLGIYTWIGYWKQWNPDNSVIYDQAGGIDIDTLDAVVSDKSVGLHFSDTQSTYLFIYNKDERQAGEWISNSEGNVSYIRFPTTQVKFFNGDRFIGAIHTDLSSNSQILSRITWNWKRQQWVTEKSVYSVSTSSQSLLATGFQEYYLTLTYSPETNSAALQLTYLSLDSDNNVGWLPGGSLTLPNVDASNQQSFYFGLGPSTAALMVVTSNTQEAVQYQVYPIIWSEDYQLSPIVSSAFSTQKNDQGNLPFSIIPQVISNSLIVSGEHFLRYNGNDWLVNSELQVAQPSSQNQYWFAYGDDYVLRTINGPEIGISTKLLVYDPSSEADTTRWTTPALLPAPPPVPPRTNPENAYFPTAGGQDYFTSGRNVYYRQSSTNWATPSQQPIFSIQDRINSKSVIDQGPNFLAYVVPDELDPDNTKTVVLGLKNGGVIGSGTTLGQQTYSVNSAAPGLRPYGSNSLVTYPGDTEGGTFDNAIEFTLHRYTGNAITGAIIHAPVTQLEVSDGFGQSYSTAYQFDPCSAACDETGKVVKYYRSQVYIGTADSSDTPFGSIENFYINGFNNLEKLTYFLNGKSVSGLAAYPELDGLKKSVEYFDIHNNSVQKKAFIWDVFTSRNTSPTEKDPVPTQLFGSYIRQHCVTQTLDGVTETTTNSFIPERFEVPFSGMVIKKGKSNFNGQGIAELLTTSKVYGHEKYPALVALNQLNVVVQETQSVTPANRETIPVGVKVNTWKEWYDGKWSKYQTFEWRGGVSSAFPFPTDYSRPEGWLCTDVVTAVNENGLILQMRNVQGAPSSVVYDKVGQYVIAQFKNASHQQGECDYYGFEDMEQTSGWSYGGDASIITGHSYAGYQSLSLGQSGKFFKTFETATKQAYVIGYWYKTPAGYVGGGTSGWAVTNSSPSDATAPQPGITKAFEDTKGQWVYDYVVVDLSGWEFSGAARVAVQATNASEDVVYIDSVRWVPQLSNFSAYVYHPTTGLTMTQLGRGTALERASYDQFYRRIGTVGPYNDQLNTLHLRYASLQGSRNQFSPEEPNSEVQIKALNGGFSETFTDEGYWQRNWHASNEGTNWKSGNGSLVHTSIATSDILTWANASEINEFALSFRIGTADQSHELFLQDSLGVKLGADTAFIWNPAARNWSFTVDGENSPPLGTNFQTPHIWTLLVKAEAILFYADGRLLLSVVTRNPRSQPVSIITGKNIFALYHLSVALKPMTGAIFQDALGNPNQKQALSGANAIVNQVIRDACGRKIVTTKSAPAFFGTAVNEIPLLAYRPDFVDVPGFLETLDESGEMEGDVSAYYSGQYDASNDQGYPYHRKLLERSPLARVVEVGAPGKDYAITNPWTTNPDQGHTVKFQYSNNENTLVSGITDLPRGEYFVTTRIQQNQSPEYQIRDKTSEVIVKAAPFMPVSTSTTMSFANDNTGTTLDGDNTNRVNRRHVTYDLTGRSVIQRPPAYFDNREPENQRFEIVQRFDTTNNLLASSTPDSGVTQMIYDVGGQLRFQQDEEGANHGYFGYYKYDALGRVIEKGIIHTAWAADSLAAYADQPSYPDSVAGQFTQKTISYIGYGNSLHGLDKIACVESFAEDGSKTTVVEHFTYDAFARCKVVKLLIRVGDEVKHDYEVAYEYLASGLMSKVRYPSVPGASVRSVFYHYDDLGRMSSVGKSEKALNTYVSYSYTPENSLSSKALNGSSLATKMLYYSPGWIKSLLQPDALQSFDESLPTYSPNGLVTAVSDVLQGGHVSETLHTQATLAANGMLDSVEYSSVDQWSLRDMLYDANSNLTNLTANGSAEIYCYNPGTNQVNHIEYEGSTILDLSYNAKGNVKSAFPSNTENPSELEFDYQKNGYLTSSVSIKESGDQYKFYYGSQGRRALKRLTNGGSTKNQKVYIHGCHGLPLMEMTSEGPVTYIYGHDGLVAFEKAGHVYFVAKDHLGSNRAVFDTQNRIQAAYSFSAFGERKTVYESTPGLLTYLYTGQEWDEDLGLYNFRARFYDQRLRRFYHTDPKHQFVGDYVFNAENPLNYTDPSGMWSIGEIFSEIGEWLLSLAEIVGGIALDVLSLGTLADVGGGTLIGAGLNGASGLVEANADGKPLSWVKFGEAEAIGAVTGTLSAGVGAAGDALADVAVNSLSDTASDTLKTGVSVAVKLAAGTVGGTASSVVGKLMDNAFEGRPLDDGLGTDVWLGTVNGFVGAALGEAGEGLTKKYNMTVKGKLVVSIGAGMITGGIGGLITWGAEGEKFNWLDFGISTTSGLIEAISGPLKSDDDEEKPTDIGRIIRKIRSFRRADDDYVAMDVYTQNNNWRVNQTYAGWSGGGGTMPW